MTDLRDPCWLCQDLGGIAVHQMWTSRRRESRPDAPPLWTAHVPMSTSHPVRPCPTCQISQHESNLRHMVQGLREALASRAKWQRRAGDA